MLVFAALLFVYLQAIMSVITIFIAVGGLHVFFWYISPVLYKTLT